jgi:hypothetical protein
MRMTAASHRLICFALCLATLLLPCGCINPGIRRDVDVLVLDAETNRPIEKATVKVGPGPRILHLPIPIEDTVATTDAAGQSTIAAPSYLFPLWINWTVAADGYDSEWQMSEWRSVPSKLLVDNSWLAWRKRATVHLYRLPGPSVSLMVPDGFRGPLFVDVVPEETPESTPIATTPPRIFTFLAAPNGYVKIAAVPILAHKPYMPRPRWEERLTISEIGGRKTLSAIETVGHIEPSANVLLRWIKSDEESATRARHLYFVGSLAEKEAFEAALNRRLERGEALVAIFAQADAAASFSPR